MAAWAEFASIEQKYSASWPSALANVTADGAAHNFDHVRLRVSGGEALEDTWKKLDAPIDDSLKFGLAVIVAFKGWVNGTTAGEVKNQVVLWWRRMAEHYADRSHRLAFNIFIEVSGIMCNYIKPKPASCPLLEVAQDADRLNPMYERVVNAVRQVTPGRIVVMPPPGKLNRPSHLSDLVVPDACNDFCMAEWHVAAAGPCAAAHCPSDGLQWHGVHGTLAERKALTTVVGEAAAWSAKPRGLPTWTGAFMPGPWNHPERGPMNITAQAGFAAAYTAALEAKRVPWAVLTAGAFLDETSSKTRPTWIPKTRPIRDALLGALGSHDRWATVV